MPNTGWDRTTGTGVTADGRTYRTRPGPRHIKTEDVMRLLATPGMTWDTAAQVLGVSRSTIRAHVKRARDNQTEYTMKRYVKAGPPKLLRHITDASVLRVMKDRPEAYVAFCNRYFPEEPVPSHIEPMIDRCYDYDKGLWKPRLIVNIPPNHAKSTYFNVRWVLWRLLLSDRNGRYLIISESDEVARSFVGEMGSHLRENEQLLFDFGAFDTSDEEVIWTQQRIRVAGTRIRRGPNILSRGWNSQIAGLRADEVICDDVFDLEDMQTDAKRKALSDKLQMVTLRRLEPGGLIRFIGTRQHLHDTYAEYGDLMDPNNGKPIYEWLVWPALRDPETGEPDMGPRSIALWPERFSKERLLGPEFLLGMSEHLFNLTMQQNPNAPEDMTFKPEWIDGCKRPDKLMGPGNAKPEGYMRVCSLDPSGGVKKGAIIVADVGTTSQGFMHCIIREIRHERMEAVDTERILAGIFGVYDIDHFVFEGSAVVAAWKNQMIDVCRQYGVRHTELPTGPGRGAVVRASNGPGQPVTIEPGAPASYAGDIQWGRIEIPYSRDDIEQRDVSTIRMARLLIDEMESYPHARSTDVLMALYFVKELWTRGYVRIHTRKKVRRPVPAWASAWGGGGRQEVDA